MTADPLAHERARQYHRERQRALGLRAASAAIRKELPDGVIQRETALKVADQCLAWARKIEEESR